MAVFKHVKTFSHAAVGHLQNVADIELFEHGGRTLLYTASLADGGMNAFVLTEGGAAQRIDGLDYAPDHGTLALSDIEMAVVNGKGVLLPSGRYDDALAVHQLELGGTFMEAYAPFREGEAFGQAHITKSIEQGGWTFLISARWGQEGLSSYRFRTDLSLAPVSFAADTRASHVDNVSAIHVMETSGKDFVFASSAMEDGISSYRMRTNGELLELNNIGAENGVGMGDPNVMTALETDGGRFLVVGSMTSNSLHVFRVQRDGNFVQVEQVIDGLETRFARVSAIETLEYEGRSFVLAAGNDGGISLFEMFADGELRHMTNAVDTTQTTLANITAIQAAFVGDDLQVFVASGSESGMTQLELDFEGLSGAIRGTRDGEKLLGTSRDDLLDGWKGKDFLSGGNGDDVIIDGKGKDTMYGGEGADVFVLKSDGQWDGIYDFEIGQDRLDLSDWPLLYDPSTLEVRSRIDGIKFEHGEEVLRIWSDDGTRLTIDDFTIDDFIF